MQEPSEVAASTITTGTPSLGFRRAGTPNGPPVVLIHGVGSASLTWQETIRRLPGDWSVIAPDLRGHGASAAPAGPYALDDLVGDVSRILDEVGLRSAHLVGFSVGAIIAARFAVLHPERVRSLVLLSSIADRTPEEQARALDRLAAISTTPPSVSAPGSAVRWFTEAFRAARPDLVGAEVAIVSATDPVGYAGVYHVLATSEIVDDVGAITAPTLIITGELDIGSTPRMSRELHSRITDSQLHILDGLKHYVHIEAADRLAALLVPFIQHHQSDPLAPPLDETGVAS